MRVAKILRSVFGLRLAVARKTIPGRKATPKPRALLMHDSEQPLLSGLAAPPVDDGRPIEVQIAEALDRAALRFVGMLTNPPPDADMKTQMECFKLAREWLIARQKVKKKDGDDEDSSGLEAAKGAFERLGQGSASKKASLQWGDRINGLEPPPKRVGKPTNEAKAQRAAYEREYEKAVAAQRNDDDSILSSRLAAVGVTL